MEKETKQKTYKDKERHNSNMIPGDSNESPDESFSQETLVFIDAGFLSKTSKQLGNGKYPKYDIEKFSKNLASKENLSCKKTFYYTAPPFQSPTPSKEESLRFKNYEKFKNKLKKKNITIKEGKCQRLKIDGKFQFKQKAVDVLLTLDLASIPNDEPNIKKIILIASDSDFIPVIKKINTLGIKTILYTYFSKKNRKSIFSSSNELIKSVHKYKLITKQDFEKSNLT